MNSETDLLLKKKTRGLSGRLVKDYELIHEGATCGVLCFQKWNDVEIMIDQRQYSIRSESKAEWLLEHGGARFAFCKRYGSGPKQEFEIEFDERVWHLKPSRQRLILGYDIWEEDLKIGRVAPHIYLWWWPKLGATFNQVPRLEIAVFAIWLVGIHWIGIAGKVNATRAQLGI